MKKNSYFFLFFFFPLIYSFSQSRIDCPVTKNNILWNGQLKLNDSTDLNFHFRILKNNQKSVIEMYNAEEVIVIDEIKETDDSLFFRMPVFDSEFKCKWEKHYEMKDSLSGMWINHARKDKNILKFNAQQMHIKPVSTCWCKPFEGKWEVTFNGQTPDEYKSIGMFKNSYCWDMIFGTFLTETGDYRYLSGSVYKLNSDTMMTLSCFDGSHAFVFKAKKKTDGTIEGDFYSALHWHEKWIAKRNDNFELKDPDSLTFLKPGYDKVEFTFPDLNNNPVSLADAKFKGKVTIIQIMGTWCPNCMDETKFLSSFYDKYKPKGLEIVGLAYERTGNFQKAVANVQRTKKKFNCKYDVLIAGISPDRNEAIKTLPMLNHIMGYPTTLYIDKKGKVRKIYTGFNGPATGKYYDKYVEDTTRFIEKLLVE